jgi:hypothetical protein
MGIQSQEINGVQIDRLLAALASLPHISHKKLRYCSVDAA